MDLAAVEGPLRGRWGAVGGRWRGSWGQLGAVGGSWEQLGAVGGSRRQGWRRRWQPLELLEQGPGESLTNGEAPQDGSSGEP